MSRRRKILIEALLILLLAALAGIFDFSEQLNFNKNLSFLPKKPFHLGLDLRGGTRLIYQADLSQIQKKDYSRVMDGLKDIIERRVNLFGVQEPLVQVQKKGENYRLIVELAGVKDVKKAIEMIGQTPYLEFREQDAKGNFKPTQLTGRYLEKAELGFDQVTYKPIVLLQFNSEGAKIFEELTKKNVGKPLAIFIDGVLISKPTVKEPITGGKAQITGDFSVEYAKKLAENLSAGALPAPITLISEQTVGPTLGQISLEKSVKAGIFGIILVMLFMILFYRLPGLVASLALFIYVLLLLALFKLIPVTLTLAGIAGFILSIGMAVDGNVLIFSRMKEELKEGKPLVIAIEEGFRRAWSSIRDGNVTTLLVALILFALGSSFIKGFALTLSLGILMSLFSAIFVTRTFLLLLAETKLGQFKRLWVFKI